MIDLESYSKAVIFYGSLVNSVYCSEGLSFLGYWEHQHVGVSTEPSLHVHSFMSRPLVTWFSGFLCYAMPVLSSSLKRGGRTYDLLTLAALRLPKPLLCGLHRQACWPASSGWTLPALSHISNDFCV